MSAVEAFAGDERVVAVEVNDDDTRLGRRRQIVMLFANRQGVSILHAPGSYGFEQSLAEVAVLRWGVREDEQWGVTDGRRWTGEAVRGWLSEEATLLLLREVVELPFALAGCEYFLGCGNAAEGLTRHPVLGAVPTCSRCAGMFELELEEVSS